MTVRGINCPTCKKIIVNPRETQIYCNQKCYAKSNKLKEQAKNSKMINSNSTQKWHTGHTHSEETKQLIRENTPIKPGKLNPKWKGDVVGYDALHDWIRAHKQFTGQCELCKLKSKDRRVIHAANISGQYKRDINDFAWLCNSCHPKFDNLKKKNLYEVIGVESKMNGTLSAIEKEKCRWYLKNNIFSKILIASKEKIKNRIHIKYEDFEEKYGS